MTTYSIEIFKNETDSVYITNIIYFENRSGHILHIEYYETYNDIKIEKTDKIVITMVHE